MDYKKENEYLWKENNKYNVACSWLCYFYLRSNDEKVNIEEVAKKMNNNIDENIIIIKRILSSLKNKKIKSKVISLTYSDYLTLQNVFKEEVKYKFQLVPFTLSIISILISCYALLNNFDFSKIGSWIGVGCLGFICIYALWHLNKFLS